ncbi:MAG: TVP38/TMEM64 family protein [Deltaproteobacteria bacterium]|nr:MAG: TVP38/TMEM64 family protein [Deltaproteobacteria bacterium]
MPPSRTALRLAAVVAVLFALWIIGAELPLLHWIAVAAARLQGAGLAGALLWGAGIYLATLLLVPIIPLILASGWLFGLWGIPISLAAAVASAATSFGIARALGRGAFARWLLGRPRARALAQLAEDGGMATVALIRISPLLPFTPSNAVLGLTGLKPRALVLGTLFGMAPGIALYVWAGSLVPSAAALERHEVPGALVWALVGCSFAAAAIIGVAAARRLRPRRRA